MRAPDLEQARAAVVQRLAPVQRSAQQACVYAWRGRASSSTADASSIFSPSSMTSTRSAHCDTTPRSCVMSRRPMDSSRRSSSSNSRMRACASDVQRRGRLVGDQQPGLAGDGHGDHDALALAAGQVVRIVLDAALRLRDLHQRQHLHRPPMRGLARQALVQAQRLDDLRAHGMHRIERGHRFLEDHRDLAAPDRAQLRRRQAHQVLPAKTDFPGDPCLRRQQAQQGQRGG